MAADLPPYMNAYGNIERILNKVKTAATPPKFTTDYLNGELGFTGGSASAFIPFAKRMGLIGSDGTPSDLYRRFRNSNSSESGRAIAEAMRQGYQILFRRHEYANSLNKNDLSGIVAEVTGLEADSKVLSAIVQSFLTLKKFADFTPADAHALTGSDAVPANGAATLDGLVPAGAASSRGLALAYTIHLILPNTTEIAVFDAIFKSLREHLL